VKVTLYLPLLPVWLNVAAVMVYVGLAEDEPPTAAR
jgi:hypothetical protein